MPTRTIASESQAKPGSVQVSQAVVDLINEMGMERALAYANSGRAPAQFVEAVRRFYPNRADQVSQRQDADREKVRAAQGRSSGLAQFSKTQGIKPVGAELNQGMSQAPPASDVIQAVMMLLQNMGGNQAPPMQTPMQPPQTPPMNPIMQAITNNQNMLGF